MPYVIDPGGFAPADPPTRSLASRFAGSLRSRGSLRGARSRLLSHRLPPTRRSVAALRVARRLVGGELDGLRARLADAETTTGELAALREERQLIRSRVGEMLSQIESLNL